MNDDELRKLFEGLSRDITDTRAELQTEIADGRRHADIAVEQMQSRFDLLAEGLASVHEELQRTRTTLDEKIERTAGETQAMIKFSHRDLDRRVTSLEETVAELQSRVERLENTAH
jgi:uncharacterized protein YceH (UPF0502 family)